MISVRACVSQSGFLLRGAKLVPAALQSYCNWLGLLINKYMRSDPHAMQTKQSGRSSPGADGVCGGEVECQHLSALSVLMEQI